MGRDPDPDWIEVSQTHFFQVVETFWRYNRVAFGDFVVYYDHKHREFGGVREIKGQPDRFYLDPSLVEERHV